MRDALDVGAARLEVQALEIDTHYLERKPAEAMRAAAARLLNDAGVQGECRVFLDVNPRTIVLQTRGLARPYNCAL